MQIAASNSLGPGSLREEAASVVSLMCMICIEDLPRQFDALLARLHPIDTNFCSDCPGSSEISVWVLSTITGQS